MSFQGLFDTLVQVGDVVQEPPLSQDGARLVDTALGHHGPERSCGHKANCAPFATQHHRGADVRGCKMVAAWLQATGTAGRKAPLTWCRRGDLNPHGPEPTSTSSSPGLSGALAPEGACATDQGVSCPACPSGPPRRGRSEAFCVQICVHAPAPLATSATFSGHQGDRYLRTVRPHARRVAANCRGLGQPRSVKAPDFGNPRRRQSCPEAEGSAIAAGPGADIPRPKYNKRDDQGRVAPDG